MGNNDAAAVQPQPAPDSCRARGSGPLSRPDPRCTPGSIDPSVTPANIEQTICHPGYTATVRPPESVTEKEKAASLAAYGDTGPLGASEYDHLIPLELGGARNDPRNLWPEPGDSPNPKDTVENDLRRAVCAGRVPLRAAQLAIARDWLHAGVPVTTHRPGPPVGGVPPPESSARAGSTPRAGSSPGRGSTSHAGDVAFCSSHRCIANFPGGHGTIVQCVDGEWSHSGGLTGVCNRHGGAR